MRSSRISFAECRLSYSFPYATSLTILASWNLRYRISRGRSHKSTMKATFWVASEGCMSSCLVQIRPVVRCGQDRPMANKQLQRTVIRQHVRAANSSFHYALAARFTRQRAAAELRR